MECISGNNLCLRYLLIPLLPKVVTLPSRMKGGGGWRVWGCAWVEMSAQSEMTTSGSKRTEQSQPPFGLWQHRWDSSTGVNLCQRLERFLWWWHIVTLDLDWDIQGHQAAPVQLLCPLRHVSPALCLTLWCTSNKGSVFYNCLQSCHVPVFS